MTKDTVGVATKRSPRGGEWADALESARLKEIHAYFAGFDVSRERVVAAGAIVRSAKLVMAAQEQALGTIDLSLSRFEVLGMLSQTDDGRLSLRDLSQVMLMHPATLTHAVDGLEERKLLRRQRPSSGDRRLVIAAITEAGRKKVVEAINLLHEADFGLGDLPEPVAADVAVLLSRMHS